MMPNELIQFIIVNFHSPDSKINLPHASRQPHSPSLVYWAFALSIFSQI